MKRILTILLVILMALSLLAGCKPQEEEIVFGPTQSGPQNPGNQTVTPGGDTPQSGETTPSQGGENTPQGGENTPVQGGENTPQGGEGTQPGKVDENNTNPNVISGNPLLSADKKYNSGAKLSFEPDALGLCKTAKMSNLDGKTLTLYTGADYSMWGYNNPSNKYIAEWDWFREVKKLYGVNIKYVRSVTGSTSVIKAFQAMSAGKDCDLITTHIGSFPYICNVLAPLDGYINVNKIADMPGLDPAITRETRWKGKDIVIGPRLANGVLNYNRTFIKGQGLDDPYTLYKAGKWNWTTFKQYMLALPDTDKNGKQVFGCATWSQFWYWANTNATPCFAIDTASTEGKIINNLETAQVKETFVWLESVCDGGGNYFDGDAGNSFHGNDKTKITVMMYSSAGVDAENVAEGQKNNEYFWVPFPKNEKNAKAVNHVEIYGFGIGLPRKTNNEGNRAAAIKFAELWCSRYTESRYDYLLHRCKWSFDAVKELYEVGAKDGRLGMGSGVGNMVTLTAGSTTNLNKSVTDASLSVSTSLAKLVPLAKKEVENVLAFGIQ